jgi:hypothetical protein
VHCSGESIRRPRTTIASTATEVGRREVDGEGFLVSQALNRSKRSVATVVEDVNHNRQGLPRDRRELADAA